MRFPTPTRHHTFSLHVRSEYTLQGYVLRTDTRTAIHGYPGNLEWDDGGPPPAPKTKDDTHFIYCPHNQTIFPTWHRPYMLLFEASILNVAADRYS